MFMLGPGFGFCSILGLVDADVVGGGAGIEDRGSDVGTGGVVAGVVDADSKVDVILGTVGDPLLEAVGVPAELNVHATRVMAANAATPMVAEMFLRYFMLARPASLNILEFLLTP